MWILKPLETTQISTFSQWESTTGTMSLRSFLVAAFFAAVAVNAQNACTPVEACEARTSTLRCLPVLLGLIP